MTTTSPSAHGESPRKALRPHQPPHNRAWHRIPLLCRGHLTRASERRDASPQPPIPRECDSRSRNRAGILVNRHKSYLGLVRSVKMQTSARQRLPRRIKKEEMKRRIVHQIALTPAWLTPRLAEN